MYILEVFKNPFPVLYIDVSKNQFRILFTRPCPLEIEKAFCVITILDKNQLCI